jgi:multiple inositol-polyphosphate phosphatase/2,3-bisphosphoglycerate 3-phosphatase
MKNRKFRTSVLSPFASNLAAVKYEWVARELLSILLTSTRFIFRCPNDSERFKVQFFLNERPIDFPWCNIGLCDLTKVISTYQRFLEADCSQIYCGGNSAGYAKFSVFLLATVAVLSRIF